MKNTQTPIAPEHRYCNGFQVLASILRDGSSKAQASACKALGAAMNLYRARAGSLVADFLSNMSDRMASSESVVKQLCNLCGRSDDDLQEAAIHLLEDILRQDAGARLLVHGKSEINRICQLLDLVQRSDTKRRCTGIGSHS